MNPEIWGQRTSIDALWVCMVLTLKKIRSPKYVLIGDFHDSAEDVVLHWTLQCGNAKLCFRNNVDVCIVWSTFLVAVCNSSYAGSFRLPCPNNVLIFFY